MVQIHILGLDLFTLKSGFFTISISNTEQQYCCFLNISGKLTFQHSLSA